MPYKDEMELISGINIQKIGKEIHDMHKNDD